MLTREAWNAFLKTLEEPPPNTVFVLATTEPHKVMPTIVDRCQRFDFQRPSLEQIAEVLRRVAAAEEIEIDDGAVAAIARSASGSFRDALGTLDQLVAYGGKQVSTDDVLAVLGVADAELIFAAADAIAAGDGRAALEVARAARTLGPRRDPVRPRPARPPAPAARDPDDRRGARTPSRSPPPTRAAASPGRRALRPDPGPRRSTRSPTALADDPRGRRAADDRRAGAAALPRGRSSIRPREALAERLERVEARFGGAPSGPVAPASAPAAAPGRPSDRLRSAVRGAEAARPSQSVLRQPDAAAPTSPGSPPEDAPTQRRPDRRRRGRGRADGDGRRPATAGRGSDLEKLVGLWPAVLDQVRESGSGLLSQILERGAAGRGRRRGRGARGRLSGLGGVQQAQGRGAPTRATASPTRCSTIVGERLRLDLRAARRRRGRARGRAEAERGRADRADARPSSTPRSTCQSRSPARPKRRRRTDDPVATGRGRLRPERDDEAGPADAGRDDRGAGEAQGRGRRGERRRRHGEGEDERRPAPARDRDRPRGDRPRGRRAAPGHGPGRGQRGAARRAGARRRARWAGSPAWAAAEPAASAASACPGCSCTRQPINRLVAELREAARDRPADRAAARLPHPARRRRGGRRARRRDPRGEGEGRPLRGLLQPLRGPALPDLRRTRAATGR